MFMYFGIPFIVLAVAINCIFWLIDRDKINRQKRTSQKRTKDDLIDEFKRKRLVKKKKY